MTQWFSTYFELVLQGLEEACLALPLLLPLLLSVVFLLLGWADDEVELRHGDDPGVAVRPVERDLEGDLPDEAWRGTTRRITPQDTGRGALELQRRSSGSSDRGLAEGSVDRTTSTHLYTRGSGVSSSHCPPGST